MTSETWSGLANNIHDRFLRNEPIDEVLPRGGRLVIERQLPFLCVYLPQPNDEDRGTADLLTAQAAYLIGPKPDTNLTSGKSRHQHAPLQDGEMVEDCSAGGDEQPRFDGLQLLGKSLFRAMSEIFDAVLVLEIWAGTNSRFDKGLSFDVRDPKPSFVLHAGVDEQYLPSTVEELTRALESIRVRGNPASVRVSRAVQRRKRMTSLFSPKESKPASCFWLGVEVDPIYRGRRSGVLFPLILSDLRRHLTPRIRQGVATFMGTNRTDASATQAPFNSYDSYGPRTMAAAVSEVDEQLRRVSGAFDFILQCTPVNRAEAWQSFQSSGYKQPPSFRYRPLAETPTSLKRRLFSVSLERIDDPTVEFLLQEKQDELDRQISALRDIETPHFLYSSLQLFGRPDSELLRLSVELLALASQQPRQDDPQPPTTAGVIKEQAQTLISFYKGQDAHFCPRATICGDIAAALMVCRDELLINSSAQIRFGRVAALLEHEIGVHLVTHFNGTAQPLGLLAHGLAGYDELQEGLAVLAECLIGGMRWSRVRTLAARVIAVESVCDGATFVETFDVLHSQYKMRGEAAFNIALRAHRGGGLTKDACYLAGVRNLLDYLSNSQHDIEPLFVGKIALRHVPFVQELRRREIINAARLIPRFVNEPEFRHRLEECRQLSLREFFTKVCQ